jgi:type IV secretory pathway VirB2 component (pilin)
VRAGSDVAGAARPGVLRAALWAGAILSLLILLQAVLAGRGQFVDRDFIALHGHTGNVVVVVAVVQFGLTLLAGLRGRLRVGLLAMTGLLAGLIVLQTGLGYMGRTLMEAAAWHIANGVLIFGLSVSNISMVLRVLRGGA